MSKSPLCLATAFAVMAPLHLSTPARACKARPHSSVLCTIVPASAEVRDAPNGRVAYEASGNVRVAGQSRNRQWAHIEVPCNGYTGWMARQNLACESTAAASAHEFAKP
ncbi:hypothetical protein SAMN05444581_13513 [Methylocapsa palsarum]|uniref:SH3 domain-containing protein n=1 Tax=Methylocapsa palsarum TaxID=1612308 RepID=A0A1I4D4H1_9HYPH|nr:hypothetical protein SAMN05444581_13513 [Methylocapsa palsarum]